MSKANSDFEYSTYFETGRERQDDPSPSFQKPLAHDHTDLPPPAAYSIFPRDIVFYRTSYISLIVGPPYEANKPQPPALFAVSINMDKRFTNKGEVPQVRLHYGPDSSFPVIGEVRFRATTTSDITISSNSNVVLDSTENSDSKTKIELQKSGALTTNTHTYIVPPQNGRETSEKYLWKASGIPAVKALATENLPGENISQQDRGLKLVKADTDEAIAVFSGGVHSKTYNPKKVAGKLRFLEEESEEMRLLTVMSILSIMERGRQALRIPSYALDRRKF